MVNHKSSQMGIPYRFLFIARCSSYGEAFKKCGNWDQGNIFLDGIAKKSGEEKKPESNAITAPPKPSGDPFGLGKMPTRRD